MARDGTTGLFESTAIWRCIPLVRSLHCTQRFLNALINRGVVELVLAIVSKEKLQALADQRFIDGFAAQRSLNQDGSAVAHIAGNHVVRQLGPPDMAERGVDGMHQVESRIDQRAVEIEDYQLDGLRIEGAAGLNHALSE